MEKLAELSLLSLFGLYKTQEKSRLQGGESQTCGAQKGGVNAYDNTQHPITWLVKNYWYRTLTCNYRPWVFPGFTAYQWCPHSPERYELCYWEPLLPVAHWLSNISGLVKGVLKAMEKWRTDTGWLAGSNQSKVFLQHMERRRLAHYWNPLNGQKMMEEVSA